MRTTFTPAPDIADRLREIARTTNQSLNAVVNDLLRKALQGERVRETRRKPYIVKAHDFQPKPGIDLEKPTEILAEIERYEN